MTRETRCCARRVGVGLVPTLAALLMPKCPVCIAAYLALFGLSASSAALIAPWLRPLSLALAVATIAGALALWWRRGDQADRINSIR